MTNAALALTAEEIAVKAAAAADAYAALKYEEELLTNRIKDARAEVIQYAGNEDHVVGDTCIVALVSKKGSETLDKAAALALLEALGATPEQIAKLIKVGKPSTALQIKPKLELAV